jgi:hypothetical protein
MATAYNTTLFVDTSTTASFRAWAQWVEDVLVTIGGWVVTDDLNQTLPSALPVCTGTDQQKGFRIYRMNDALQATAPVFMRIDYGSGRWTPSNNGPPWPCAVWLTIGTGTNGGGAITGTVIASRQVGNFGAGLGVGGDSMASVANNRFVIALWAGSGAGSLFPVVFSVERSVDATGAYTGDGVMVVHSTQYLIGGGYGSYGIGLAYSPHGAIGQPLALQQPIDIGLSWIHCGASPTPTYLGDRGVGVLYHFRGIALQPGTNWIIANINDFGAQGFLKVNFYGHFHTYIPLSNQVPPVFAVIAASGFGAGNVADTGRIVLMRYD